METKLKLIKSAPFCGYTVSMRTGDVSPRLSLVIVPQRRWAIEKKLTSAVRRLLYGTKSSYFIVVHGCHLAKSQTDEMQSIKPSMHFFCFVWHVWNEMKNPVFLSLFSFDSLFRF